jgi:hypothetical protein
VLAIVITVLIFGIPVVVQRALGNAPNNPGRENFRRSEGISDSLPFSLAILQSLHARPVASATEPNECARKFFEQQGWPVDRQPNDRRRLPLYRGFAWQTSEPWAS